MLSIIRQTFAPLLSLFILILGSGLLITLLALRLDREGAEEFVIGSMTGVYYLGLIVASFRIERSIIRVGHIRAFSAFASALSVITLLHGLFVIPWFWLILRFLGGFATAGLFIVIESWLLLAGTIKTRGQVLALYMVALYAAQAMGQFLVNLGEVENLSLFVISAMLSSLSVIPLAMSKVGSPQIEEPESLSFKSLYRKSASGIVGCFAGGLIMGAIYGLLPLFVLDKTNDPSDVAFFMAITIFGGMALQYPVGRLSDFVDRRVVLLAVCSLASVMTVFIIAGFQWVWLATIALFLFGGLTFIIYPISISHACDALDSSELVSATQGLLLAYSVGASIGPFVAPLFMDVFGTNGLFLYFLLINALLGGFFFWRRTQAAPPVHEEQFVPLPQTTPVTASLDPRGDDLTEGEVSE